MVGVNFHAFIQQIMIVSLRYPELEKHEVSYICIIYVYIYIYKISSMI